MTYKNSAAVFGISPFACEEQIRHVCHRMAKKSHPDISRTVSADTFSHISDAYKIMISHYNEPGFFRFWNPEDSFCKKDIYHIVDRIRRKAVDNV